MRSSLPFRSAALTRSGMIRDEALLPQGSRQLDRGQGHPKSIDATTNKVDPAALTSTMRHMAVAHRNSHKDFVPIGFLPPGSPQAPTRPTVAQRMAAFGGLPDAFRVPEPGEIHYNPALGAAGGFALQTRCAPELERFWTAWRPYRAYSQDPRDHGVLWKASEPRQLPKPSPHMKARDAEILALRREGWSLLEIGRRFKVSAARVQQIINGTTTQSNAFDFLQDQASAQLEAVDGVACIEAGMSVQRLAWIAGTTPWRVEKWMRQRGIAKSAKHCHRRTSGNSSRKSPH